MQIAMDKQLKIVADDFGYGYSRNLGILECYQQRAITAVSLLVNCKHSLHAVHLSKKHGIPTGLHFNITEGFPLSHPQSVRSLVTSSGNFLGREGFWSNPKLNPWHIEEELIAQIEWFKRAFGTLPAHVDGHQHVHVHPNVIKVFATVLRNYNIFSTRMPVEDKASPFNRNLPLYRAQFHHLINNVASKAKNVIKCYNVNSSQTFVGLNTMGSDMSVESLQRILLSIYSRGITSCELMTHPGYRCDRYTDGFIGEPYADLFACSYEREHEMNVLTSRELLKFYNKEGISILKW